MCLCIPSILCVLLLMILIFLHTCNIDSILFFKYSHILLYHIPCHIIPHANMLYIYTSYSLYKHVIAIMICTNYKCRSLYLDRWYRYCGLFPRCGVQFLAMIMIINDNIIIGYASNSLITYHLCKTNNE